MNEESIKTMIDFAAGQLGSVDIVVNSGATVAVYF
jgi:hypothetical protein